MVRSYHLPLAALLLSLLSLAGSLRADPPPAAPTDVEGSKKALVGTWTVDKDSFRDAVLKNFNANGQPVPDEVKKLIDQVVEKSDMKLAFRADGTMTATAKIVAPVGDISQESAEEGTWKLLGMKDKALTLETATKDKESGEQKTEQIELKFLDGDQVQVHIPSQKVDFRFKRAKTTDSKSETPQAPK